MADLLNGLFEFAAALAILHHCWKLFGVKDSRGISLISTAFFASWSLWNLFYYPFINQPMSFYGGIAVFFANSLWVALQYRYRKGPQ